eukprot:658190_1
MDFVHHDVLSVMLYSLAVLTNRVMESSFSVNLKLDSLIEGTTCIRVLTSLLNSICSLEEIKGFVKQRVSAMDIEQKQNLYLKAAPMDDVLPHCILQHTIGFIEDLRDIALVNKAFHKCCDSIQRLLIKQKETDWQTEFTDLHSDFNDGRIIHVYPDPSWRHNMLQRAIQYAQSGDTLLIHEGNYEFNHAYELNENIKLIGYGPNVVVRAHYGDNESTDELVEITFNAQYLYLQNITFDMDETFCMCFQSAVGVFYMEQCVINFATAALMIRSAKTVKIKNGSINGDMYMNSVGIDVSHRPKILEIESCVFKWCCSNGSSNDDHCIYFTEKMSTERTKFKCISNCFDTNFGLPIVAENPSEFNIEDTQIMNNTWVNNWNPTLLPYDVKVDANKIYSNTIMINRIDPHET